MSNISTHNIYLANDRNIFNNHLNYTELINVDNTTTIINNNNNNNKLKNIIDETASVNNHHQQSIITIGDNFFNLNNIQQTPINNKNNFIEPNYNNLIEYSINLSLQQANPTIASSLPITTSQTINTIVHNLSTTNSPITIGGGVCGGILVSGGVSGVGGITKNPRIIKKTTTPLIDYNRMGSETKTFSNGDDNFMDFGNYSTRDAYYSIQSPNAHDLNNLSSFPPIGTFSVDSSNSTVNQLFAGQQELTTINNGVLNNRSRNSFTSPRTGSMSNGSNGGNNTSSNSGNASSYNGNNNGGDNQGTRETGIIEKLLQHSYGFIQCCERQARLFFHFSQFSGNIEHLKIGDPVEFEMTYDRRTGKPIASQVTKIAPEVVLSEERVTGTVTTEIKSETSGSSGENTGRISYENRGECFFLPYTKDDVEGNVSLRSGDKVSFQIATNQRGNLGACHIRLENPVHPVKYRGVVCSMKESFGFIERADVVKEIFFHFSEADVSVELRPGDDVEFIIQTRNGKEVACNIVRLPPGSVIFEDVGTVVFKGQVLKPLDRNNPLRHNNDPLPGRIRYRAPDHSEVEVPFGDKDQKGDFTLRHGDWVQFLLATDRRDQLQRATSISLLDETFDVSGEKREQGVIASLKEGFGFLRCVDRNTRLFFHFTEVLDTAREIYVSDEVEFTVIQDPSSSFSNTRFSAIRIKHLPSGSVQFETLVESNLEGVITREAPKSPTKSLDRTEGGVISYNEENGKKTIMYFLKDCEKPPRAGDIVKFNICQVKRTKELIAVNVQDVSAVQQQERNFNNVGSKTNNNSIDNNSSKNTTYQGFIAVLKDNFGFIETISHEEEVFFHFSNFIGNPNTLELGQEVEYSLSVRPNNTSCGNCLPAENVKILQKGSIFQPKIIDTLYNGVVLRPLRCVNPDQVEYCGLVQINGENGQALTTHDFGITSLINKRDLLQKHDTVTFKLDDTGRATEILAIRKKKRANVDSIKGLFGFLDFEIEEGKKLFFHMSEVQGNGNNLHSGDTVEFSIVTNQRSGKSSACNVAKVYDGVSARPERILSRLKVSSIEESGPKILVIRQPKGPDGTKGFSSALRATRSPGVYVEN